MTVHRVLEFPFVLGRGFDVAEIEVLVWQALIRASYAYPSLPALYGAAPAPVVTCVASNTSRHLCGTCSRGRERCSGNDCGIRGISELRSEDLSGEIQGQSEESAHMSSWHLLVSSRCQASNTGHGFTMQHVYGHSGNLGNECADLAAANRDIRTCLQPKKITLKETSKRDVLNVGMNPILYLTTTTVLNCTTCFTSVWEQANELPRRNQLLHDLITQTFLRSLQCGIVVMRFIDAFVYAHHQHRRSNREFWKLWGLHERENPPYHGYHSRQCPHVSSNLLDKTHAHPTSACLSPKPDIRIFPTFVPQHVKEVLTSRDVPSIQTAVPALLMVKPQLDGVSLLDLTMEEQLFRLVQSSPPRLTLLSLVPELTPTTLLRLTAMIEALSFLGPVARLPVMRIRVFVMTPNMLLVFAWARFKPAHMSSWHLRVKQSMLSVQHRLRLTMQHVHGHSGNLVK